MKCILNEMLRFRIITFQTITGLTYFNYAFALIILVASIMVYESRMYRFCGSPLVESFFSVVMSADQVPKKSNRFIKTQSQIFSIIQSKLLSILIIVFSDAVFVRTNVLAIRIFPTLNYGLAEAYCYP